jgi:DNA polymerase III delta prime subunit
MALFKDILRADETLFKNEYALDYEFIPKLLPYREEQQKYIAKVIAPLLQKRDGRNLFIYGSPGIGKTAAIKWVLRDLEEETTEVHQIYINCWQKILLIKLFLISVSRLVISLLTIKKLTSSLRLQGT